MKELTPMLPENIHDGNLVLALKIIDKMPNVAL